MIKQMLKIILIILVIALACFGFLIWSNKPTTKLLSPAVQKIGKVLSFQKKGQAGDESNLLDKTKDSVTKNTQNTIDTVKSNIYTEAKTTLDNVFHEQNKSDKKQTNSDQIVNVAVLGVSNTANIHPSYVIDLSSSSNLNLSLSVNKEYYLKFQNIPANYCIYINNDKYPLTDGMIKIQFTKSGNFPIKANSCDLNDKNIGTLSVQ